MPVYDESKYNDRFYDISDAVGLDWYDPRFQSYCPGQRHKDWYRPREPPRPDELVVADPVEPVQVQVPPGFPSRGLPDAVFKFGAHQGQSVSAVDIEYLRWCQTYNQWPGGPEVMKAVNSRLANYDYFLRKSMQ